VAVLESNVMLSIAEKALTLALKKGAVEAEAYVYEGQATNVGIEFGQISKSNRIIDRGVSIRVVVNKSMGFAYTNMLENQDAIDDIVNRALNSSKASKPDPDWKGFAQPKPYASLQGTFDSQVANLESEEMVNIASKMLDSASQVNKKVRAVEGGVGSAYIANAIVNSNGISGFEKGTVVECNLACLAQEKKTVTPVCFEFDASRTYKIDPVQVGKESGKLALSALKTKPIESKKTKLILTQFALQDLLSYTLINAVKADSVQRNQSPFKGKIGEKVASENLTIYDDGLLPNGMRTWMFDGEGVPSQKTPIIQKGVLKNFLYDNYCSKKEGKESTGNASRAGYLSTTNIDTTNFHIMPGSKNTQELLSEIDDGLLVYYLQGAHSSNPVSGEFSVVATPAWRVNKGEIAEATRGVMLAGNIFEVLKNIALVGSNERQMGSLIAPWVVVENIQVIGKGP
jgi:PmbA protein